MVASALAPSSSDAFEPKRGVAKWPELADTDGAVRTQFQIGPTRQCDWVYSGLARFKNAAFDDGFDPRDNAFVTVSRRGLTARVIGTFMDEFVAMHGGSVEDVARKFPWVIPIRQTAIHRSRPEDPSVPARARAERGEVVSTEVRNLPPSSVMIVYPVAVGNRAAGSNTLAGNWTIVAKQRRKPNNRKGAFGQFPFLLYTGSNGHALHGPVTRSEVSETWYLRRGEVSHGCNRMEGEHVTELAVLMGCAADPGQGLCPRPRSDPLDDERVHVIEEFDVVPDPSRTVPEGVVSGWPDRLSDWVGIDVDYPRERDVPRSQRATIDATEGFYLEKTLVRPVRGGQAPAFVRRFSFPTWDNRDRHLVRGTRCR